MSAYRCGSFDKIREFIKLRERLSSSLHYSSVSVEKKLSDLALTTGLLTITVDFSKVSNFFRGHALSAHAVFWSFLPLFHPPYLKHHITVTNYARLFFGPFEKKSRPRKLKPQENNSKLKQKTQGFGKILKITTNCDPIKG